MKKSNTLNSKFQEANNIKKVLQGRPLTKQAIENILSFKKTDIAIYNLESNE